MESTLNNFFDLLIDNYEQIHSTSESIDIGAVKEDITPIPTRLNPSKGKRPMRKRGNRNDQREGQQQDNGRIVQMVQKERR